jgi:hypothetical protein
VPDFPDDDNVLIPTREARRMLGGIGRDLFATKVCKNPDCPARYAPVHGQGSCGKLHLVKLTDTAKGHNFVHKREVLALMRPAPPRRYEPIISAKRALDEPPEEPPTPKVERASLRTR